MDNPAGDAASAPESASCEPLWWQGHLEAAPVTGLTGEMGLTTLSREHERCGWYQADAFVFPA